MLTFTMDEVGMLALIAAKHADAILTEEGTDDKLKALALKCKASATFTPQANGNHFIQLGRYQVVFDKPKPRRNRWTLEW